uniref:Uncharacterized protein n=1 Tax=viral metagenome TaxID=1070528 RepID=A0A6H1ZYX8_9ZZZZ
MAWTVKRGKVYSDDDSGWSLSAERIVAEVERLQAIVDKLPKTADGVSVVPGKDEVWLLGNPPTCCSVFSNHSGAGEWVHTSNIQHSYSTREAAEAAGKDGER